MSLNLPSINLIKNTNLNLKIKNLKNNNEQEIKEKNQKNTILNNKIFFQKEIGNKTAYSVKKFNDLKTIGLKSLL